MGNSFEHLSVHLAQSSLAHDLQGNDVVQLHPNMSHEPCGTVLAGEDGRVWEQVSGALVAVGEPELWLELLAADSEHVRRLCPNLPQDEHGITVHSKKPQQRRCVGEAGA